MAAITAAPKSEARSQWLDTWQRFFKHKGAVLGMVILGSIFLVVFVGPLIYRVDPQYIDYRARSEGPSLAHPFGTDNLGRDIFAQNLAGGRISLAVGISSMLISVLIGTLLGMLSGFFRWLDGPLMRLTDLFLALPLLPLLLVTVLLFRDTLRSAFGPETGIFLLIVSVIGLTSWMNTARVVRGDVLAVREREFVTAANALGAKNARMLWQHVLPNVLSPVLVSATLGMANAIITESAVSFLGLGFPPDFPTWGRLLADGVPFIEQEPGRVIWPGLLISLTVLSVNFIGDGLRDALDPRLRK